MAYSLETGICYRYPKKSNPQSLGNLRNISCTMLASKIFESYVLDFLKEQVKLRTNQYGGIRGRHGN